MSYFKFIFYNKRFLSFGFILILFSGFGQTFFLSLFNSSIQTSMHLSNGRIGLLYSAATLTSAVFISLLGGKIDSMSLPRFTLLVCLGLVIACISMALSHTAAFLFVSYLLLRFFGQGMMCHASMTSMARYFDHQRGKAVSLATLGYPLGEACFPLIAVVLLNQLGFSLTWSVLSAFAAFIITPLLLGLLKGHHQRHQHYLTKEKEKTLRANYQAQTKAMILKDWRFYCITLGVLATGFINTGIFFQHNALIQARHWTTHFYAVSFIGYAMGNVVGSLLCGVLTDRFKASNLITFYLIPMLIGLCLLTSLTAKWTLYSFMIGSGLSQGASSILIAALWAELYGTALLGTIRSWVVTLKVFFTALSPVLFGVLIDYQVSINKVLLICVIYCLLSISLLSIAQWGGRGRVLH